MTYTKIVDDPEVDREDIEDRLDEFDYIIGGSVHRGVPFLEEFREKRIETAYYLCGEDEHHRSCKAYYNLFLRE